MNKRRGLFAILITIVICLSYASITYSVESDTATKKANDEFVDKSYLAKFNAVKTAEKLSDENLQDIMMLKVIVTNFSDKGWGNDYQSIQEGYKNAMENYYKRDIIQAKIFFEKNRDDINKLFKKIIDNYTDNASKILDECASKVLELHLDAVTNADPDKKAALMQNQARLKIAYSQFDEAKISEKNRYFKGAVFHLKVAKSQGIKILEDLAKDNELKGVQDKYKKDKADNLNRVYGESEKTGK